MKKEVSHLIRDTWRFQALQKWLSAEGKVQTEAAGLTVTAERQKQIRKLYLDGSSTTRALFLNRVKSPMAYARSFNDDQDVPCIWSGCQELGTWHHVLWQ